MLALAVGQATGADDLVTWLQAAGGLILLPAWLIRTDPTVHSGQSAVTP